MYFYVIAMIAFTEEFLVSMWHRSVFFMSVPFVHFALSCHSEDGVCMGSGKWMYLVLAGTC